MANANQMTSNERVMHSAIWGCVAFVVVLAASTCMVRGCEAANKRWQTYVDQGRSEVGNGIWVRVGDSK